MLIFYPVENFGNEENDGDSGQGSATQHGQERLNKGERFPLPDGARQRQLRKSQSFVPYT